jgi:hypothetical protein
MQLNCVSPFRLENIHPQSLSPRPDLLGDVCDQLKLCPLFIHAQGITAARGGEAALRRQREAVRRHIARCRFDASCNIVPSFQHAGLSSDKTKDDDFILWCVFERLKRAGALAVVFQ